MNNSTCLFTGHHAQAFKSNRGNQTSKHSFGAMTETAELVEEVPLAISINDIAYAVMMVTPLDLEAFVIGFARSEGIIEGVQDVRDLSIEHKIIEPEIDSLAINLELSPRRFNQFKQRRKAHLGATGCGLCGIESLNQAIPTLPPLPHTQDLEQSILNDLRNRLSDFQKLGKKTGAVHGALLISPKGDPLLCMEDIGRHNALDKVIGYALQHRINLYNHSVLMSSRCSTELVQKAVRVGLSRLIHLASPSTLAVKLAQHYGLALIHLPKQDAPRMYASSATREGKNDE